MSDNADNFSCINIGLLVWDIMLDESGSFCSDVFRIRGWSGRRKNQTHLSRAEVFLVTSSVADCSCLAIFLWPAHLRLHLDLPSHLAISPWRRLDLLRGSGWTQGGHPRQSRLKQAEGGQVMSSSGSKSLIDWTSWECLVLWQE